jgi:hypothetical protein
MLSEDTDPSEQLGYGGVQDFCISPRLLAKRLVTVVAGHDEHLHITASEHFCVLGGAAQAHAHVVQMVLKMIQDLEAQGYTLEEASPEALEVALQKICFQSSL